MRTDALLELLQTLCGSEMHFSCPSLAFPSSPSLKIIHIDAALDPWHYLLVWCDAVLLGREMPA